MSWLARIRNAFRPDDVSDEIEREMAFHIDSRAADLQQHGMSPQAARLEARRRFGNVGMQQEQTRDRDLFGWLESIVADVRYAMRGLRGAPGFAAVAILSLALGIGANTSIFTLLNVAMFRSLPVANPEELVELQLIGAVDKKGPSFSPKQWEFIRDQQDVFSSVFAYGSTGSGDLSTGGEMRQIPVGLVTGSFFSTLGVQPAAGRLLTSTDDTPGCAGAVVVTHSFWQSEYGGDAGVVGRVVHINGRPFEIAGVAEPGFIGLGFGYYPPIWGPQCAGPLIRGSAYSGGGAIIGRLKPGVTLEQVRARMASLTPGLVEATMVDQKRTRVIAIEAFSFANGFGFIREEYGNGLIVLMAIVGVVLLIACANTANLLLARATARSREVAVRLALGAGAGRLVRQLLTESLLLAMASAAVGMLFAMWGTRLLVGLLSRPGRPFIREVAPDAHVLAFTVGVAVLTALIFGLVPAWRAVRVKPGSAMSGASRGEVEGHSRLSIAKSLVVAQVALSLVMLSGASVLIDRWRGLLATELGFRPDGVLLVSVNARQSAIPDSQLSRTYARTLERLRGVRGVVHVSASNRTPIGNTGWTAKILVDGVNVPNAVVTLNDVSADYFATIGTRLIMGRDFSAGDVPGTAPVAIVNQELVRRFFGQTPALAKRFRIDWRGEGSMTYEIVGIVEDTKEHFVTETPRPVVYFALSQNRMPEPYINFAVRGNDATALIPSATAAIMETSPRLSLQTRTLQSQVDESVRIPRTLSVLSGAFGALGLLLASIGLYGIMAYRVARRRNEIGVRIALGADKSRIVRMVLSDVGRIVAAGLVIGGLMAYGAQRALASVLAGVDASVGQSLALSAVILAAVAFAAASLPAWRAGKQDPVTALRSD